MPSTENSPRTRRRGGLSLEGSLQAPLIEDKAWGIHEITHSIVFDDGEEFIKEGDELRKRNVAMRLIEINITRVVNIKKETKYADLRRTSEYEYIGRGSYWGNPYSMFAEGDTREEVIRKFKYDFDYEKFPNKSKSEVFKLVGKRLGCFCKPDACHGDVLADFLNEWDDGK
ncbi:DUF4326 domain-containing protein [Undibacterium sp. JH2W]|uniref:DUF4326 domain-containing protein n=1 Tax=Undibacterium sp. JH2W TaxID=3413037 RepID=UPI003BEFD104